VLIFIASLGSQISYPELVGASMVAGACVVLLGALRLTGRLAALIPAPIVLGLLAGAVLPYVWGIFDALGDEPLVVGSAFAAYLLSRRFGGDRLPAVLPALVVGIASAGLTGRLGTVPVHVSLPDAAVTMPIFSVYAIATVTPVLIILITVQSNVPSQVFLRSQGYQPPERVLNAVSGIGTLLGSLLGPTGISLSLPATALVAGPDAGEQQIRHWSVYISASAVVLIALLAGIAADLPAIVPLLLLLALAGLATVGVLANALQQITRGPLLLGPLFALVIALSDMSLLGFGPFFWSLVAGTGISLLLERDAWQAMRTGGSR
jgi:benzoate membrane transport protein